MNNEKKGFFQNFGVVFLYVIICITIFLYRLIVVAVSDIAFSFDDFIFKTVFDNIIILVIFVVGYPDGKNDAKNEEPFKIEANALNEKIQQVVSQGKNIDFRKHCEIFNSNEEYYAIKNILELECGLTIEYYFKSQKELRELLKKGEIDRKRFNLIKKCQNHNFYYPKVNANKILTADTTSEKISYTLNETNEMLLIIVPKIILTCLIAALFSFNLGDVTFLFSAEGLIQAIGSLLTSVLSIVFARRSGASVIQKRRVMFHRWNSFIVNFFEKPLSENDRLVLKMDK